MNARLLILALEAETDIVLVRKRARRLAELVGFEPQDQTRITTAVSEIARNALEYAGGGRVEFRLTGSAARQQFEIIVSDRGPGIARLDAILGRLATIGYRDGDRPHRRAAADGRFHDRNRTRRRNHRAARQDLAKARSGRWTDGTESGSPRPSLLKRRLT